MSSCEMCGVSSSKLKEMIVEGTLLSVCDKCGGFGNAINMNSVLRSRPGLGKGIPRKIFLEEQVDFVIESAGKLVKDAREKKGLKQSQFASMVGVKESVVHKIETSLMKPDIYTARKIEKILDIKIIEDYDDPEKSVPIDLTDENLTIGDLAKFKK